MTSPIRFGGLASGIDTDTLIKSLMQAERVPVDRLEQKKQVTEWKRDAYREINRSLLALRTSAVDLIFSRNFYAKTASSSDDTRVSVVSGPSSGNSAISIQSVSQLATSPSHITEVRSGGNLVTNSTSVASLGLDVGRRSQTLTTTSKELTLRPLPGNTPTFTDKDGNSINLAHTYDAATGKITFDDGVEIPEGAKVHYEAGYQIQLRNKSGGNLETVFLDQNATFKDVVTALNGTRTGVSAFFNEASGEISITGKSTGTSAIIEFEGAAKNLFALSGTKNGSDAQVNINGINLTQSSNTFTIDNMTITLKSTFTDGKAVNLSSATDTQKVFDNIKSFIDKYNETIDLMNKKTREDRFRSFAPLTKAQRDELSEDEIKKWEEKAMSGMLRNDTIVRGAMDNLRGKWSSSFSSTNSPEASRLFQIGLATNADFTNGGKIEINEEKLKAAIEKNPEEVYQLFSNAQNGLLPQIRDAAGSARSNITRIAGSEGSGAPTYSMGREMSQIDSRIQRLNALLVNKENAYYRRFAAMETAMNQANSQAASLQQFLGGGM
ncbi:MULTISPECIES: flagellar filament capping protein FliD [Exiguobacterium]|uniref:flagellar filament capping protein FliD n=1 Tax=Exiguobacterium TaxID=33986 RepID=UPI001BEB2AED|nr:MULTISPECIES: flagellar filament capping protein FliD [Exiguobacterium]MCT4784105.1 flagellar filament capping protein FliD [Exiguobacterium himgiriensis]